MRYIVIITTAARRMAPLANQSLGEVRLAKTTATPTQTIHMRRVLLSVRS